MRWSRPLRSRPLWRVLHWQSLEEQDGLVIDLLLQLEHFLGGLLLIEDLVGVYDELSQLVGRYTTDEVAIKMVAIKMVTLTMARLI